MASTINMEIIWRNSYRFTISVEPSKSDNSQYNAFITMHNDGVKVGSLVINCNKNEKMLFPTVEAAFAKAEEYIDSRTWE
ncbi:hypothetical protein JMN32_03565 [Fulvivirga sp. 29W222]|uniref:Uncharacterized protein n=1 Tax=Fulvivirga marina TaxID=2494733 RepID=A0A937KB31_9BACT|nr:hypothetical protein [Fulvivirga marina]MBL6445352.1 hypothetical protein [Fulvivirga marina]MBL6445369.1 hypothetical protein [Fulvivirga marina]